MKNARYERSSSAIFSYFLMALPLMWLAISARGIWSYASQETEPPVFDALSYVQKAQAFWAAVSHLKPFNPLRVEPVIRPFGTVFFTYPFGFSNNFHFFYFLTNFLPSIIFAAAVVIAAAPIRNLKTVQKYVLSLVVVAALSMPAYFQFAAKDGFQVIGTWGFVDMIFGSVGALACSFIVSGAVKRTVWSAGLSAALAVLTILIKPAGLALMLVIAGSWGFLQILKFSRGEIAKRDLFRGSLVFLVIYLVTAITLFNSPYFSEKNYQYGESSLRLLHEAQVTFPTISEIAEKIGISIGAPLAIVWFIGIYSSLVTKRRALTFLSLACVLAGTWLWLGRTNIDMVRYFLPFPMMAIVFVIPGIIERVEAWKLPSLLLTALLIAPTLVIGYMLIIPAPPIALQKLVGVSLSTNLRSVVVAQAKQLAAEFAEEPNSKNIIYYIGGSPNVNAFEAVMDWDRVLNFPGGNSIPALPVDWVRESAYRLDDLIAARYLVFDAVNDPEAVLSKHGSAISYDDEQLLVRCWLSTLDESDGIRVRSDSGVRLIEVTNRVLLARSAAHLVSTKTWRKIFIEGLNPIRVLSNRNEVIKDNLLSSPVALFHNKDHVANIVGVTSSLRGDTQIFYVFVQQLEALPPDEDGSWHVFVHRIGLDGITVGAYSSYFSDASLPNDIVRYRLQMPTKTGSITKSLGVGVYKHDEVDGDQNFMSENGDWGGRRTLIPMKMPDER